MCTISFIPFDNKVFITHNRDEQSSRAKALAPAAYTINGYTLLFPKDSTAGGAWIGVNQNGNAAVLLNGGFKKHLQQPPYRKSRGLVFLDIVAASDLYISYQKTDLTGIEPFTIILWSNRVLYECRWDGQQKHIAAPDPAEAHVWSSVTLYDEAITSKRKSWFDNWMETNPAPSLEEIIQFHSSAGDGDPHNDLRMNRNGEMLTVSITAMELTDDKSVMQYLDLQDNTRTTQSIHFTKAPAIQ